MTWTAPARGGNSIEPDDNIWITSVVASPLDKMILAIKNSKTLSKANCTLRRMVVKTPRVVDSGNSTSIPSSTNRRYGEGSYMVSTIDGCKESSSSISDLVKEAALRWHIRLTRPSTASAVSSRL